MFFFFKQKTAYEMRISDWSSDVCSSDLRQIVLQLTLYVFSVIVVAGWRASQLPHAQGLFARLAIYAGLCTVLGIIIRSSWFKVEWGTLKAAVQIQALAILCAIISVLLLNDILPSNDAHLWLVLCSFAVVGAVGFFHSLLGAGNFVMIVLAGTIQIGRAHV